MFWKYTKRDRFKYLSFKAFVLIGLILTAWLAIETTDTPILNEVEGWKVGIGVIIVGLVFLISVFDLFKKVFKSKGALFVILSISLYLLSNVIELLIASFGFMSIPLLINDIVIKQYFRYLDIVRYDRDVSRID